MQTNQAHEREEQLLKAYLVTRLVTYLTAVHPPLHVSEKGLFNKCDIPVQGRLRQGVPLVLGEPGEYQALTHNALVLDGIPGGTCKHGDLAKDIALLNAILEDTSCDHKRLLLHPLSEGSWQQTGKAVLDLEPLLQDVRLFKQVWSRFERMHGRRVFLGKMRYWGRVFTYPAAILAGGGMLRDAEKRRFQAIVNGGPTSSEEGMVMLEQTVGAVLFLSPFMVNFMRDQTRRERGVKCDPLHEMPGAKIVALHCNLIGQLAGIAPPTMVPSAPDEGIQERTDTLRHQDIMRSLEARRSGLGR